MSERTTPTTPPSPPPPRRRKRRWGCQVVLLLLVVAGVTTFFICRRLWQATPEYWTANEEFLKQHDNADLMDMADRAEKRLLDQLTDAGTDTSTPGIPEIPASVPDNSTTAPTIPHQNEITGSNLNQPRKIHLSLAEVNAWLAVKLETWAAYQNITLPPQVNGYMVTTEGQNLVVAFQYNSPQLTQVVSVVFHVEMLPGGEAQLQIESLRGGELRLPKGLALSQVQGAASGAQAEEINRAVAMIDGKKFSPVHKLDSVRQIRLLDYKLRPDGADVTVETELQPKGKHAEEAGTEP